MASRGTDLDLAHVDVFDVARGGAFVGGAAGVSGDATDLERFLALMERHTPALLKVTASMVGYADAEDAAQEAVLKAWRARTTLRDVEKLRPWLLQIAVNVCREWRRSGFGRRQHWQIAFPDDANRPLATIDTYPGASEHTAGMDVRQAINALDHDLRLVVVLRYYGGMNAAEIGVALSAPPATIRTRLRRALRLLRQRLRDWESLPAVERGEGGTHV